ncbi:MAG: flagellar M-ring protein FliF [Sphingobium sp.]|nr:flagellar M-ring protein FliF [Sphingobium sp.]
MSETAASSSAVPAVSSSAGGSGGLPAAMGGLNDWRARFTDMIRQPAVARSLPLLGLLGVVGAAALLWMSMREAPQRDLFRGLPDSDKAAVVEVLEKNNIPYKLDASNGAITVSEDQYFPAKMMLASSGLPKSAPDGNTLIDSLPMGASRAVEGEKLRSAREMDLARTIEAIDSVESARVHLAVTPPSVFLRDRSKPAASVMLRLAKGGNLSDEQVQAIVHLVASSVPELTPESVSVVDQNGRLLSNAGGLDGSADKQLAVQNRIEDRYRQAITALLTPIIGDGKFSTEVHADVNFDERQATRETYPQEEARLRAETGSWQATKPGEGKEGETGGIPGALSNQAPPPAVAETQAANVQQAGATTNPASASANGQTQPELAPLRTQENYNRSFELGREVSVTRDAVGTVKRLSVAVALDVGADGKPRSAQEIAALEALVKSAVGFSEQRGDVVSLSSRSFVKDPNASAETPFYETDWFMGLARNVSALAVALVLIFGLGRPLMKKITAGKKAQAEGEAVDGAGPSLSGPGGPLTADQKNMGQNKLGHEISEELIRNAQENPDQKVTLDMISATPDYARRADLIRNFVKQDPDRAALVVRDLLKENKAKENA